MSRKRLHFIWCMLVFVASYIIIALMTNFKNVRGKLTYMSKLNAFYHDIGLSGLDRNLLLRQRLHVQSSFQEMLAGDSVESYLNNSKTNDVHTVKLETGGKIKETKNLTLINRRKHANSLDKLLNFKEMEKKYLTIGEARVNPFDFKFIEPGENICSENDSPFLVILCLSKYYDVETREAIRNTWGSVATKKQWPGSHESIPGIKLLFLLGSHEDSLVKRTIIEDEEKRFGDIIVADFKDSYSNLTFKVMMGLKWVSKNCPSAKYVVKIDQDTFLHVANLIHFLQFLPEYKEGIIIGYFNTESTVMRTGRWGVDRRTFPLPKYPNYTNGNCYVISGNIVPDLLSAAEHMQYMWVEDAFITGIVRTALGVKLLHHKGFSKWSDKPPRLCGFHNEVRIAATNTDNERKYNLWKALGYIHLRNCYDVNKYKEV